MGNLDKVGHTERGKGSDKRHKPFHLIYSQPPTAQKLNQ